jgi:hypothetical protein
LQHWLWKFLQDRTRQFAHLHKDDSSSAGCAYIESVNTSVSQLSHLPHLSVPGQVLFDAGCTDYADDRAHIAIAHAAEKLLRADYESTDDDGDA